MNVYVIAEIGVNHNGDVDLAHRLIDVAVSCGADAVKFQTFSVDRLVARNAATAEYQRRATGHDTQTDLLSGLALSADAYEALSRHCRESAVEFLSTPFAEEDADFLLGLGVSRFKVASGELTNHPFLKHVAALGLPLIVSTGMADMDEVREALEIIERALPTSEAMTEMLTLLHCTSNYPTLPEDVNLLAMRTMAEAFRVPCGYSDHTAGISVSIAATALGATMIEKHLTLDRTMPGPDHAASLEPEAFTRMVEGIREVSSSLGDGVKRPRESELPVRTVARRSVALRHDRPAGAILQRDDLIALRPGTGIAPSELEGLVGRRLALPVNALTLLTRDALEA